MEMQAIVLARLTQEHRHELAKLTALLVRYREVIEDAGLVPPDETGAEALARFRFAFEAAGLSDTMQHPELLADWSVAAA